MTAAVRVELAGPEETEALGARLARALAAAPRPPAVLMQGPLGAGKTTLVRGLAAALPGGDQAQVSSPSFTVMNCYPTRPETFHMDLYRLEGMDPDQDLLELLHNQGSLVLVEWAEHLPEAERPEDYLLLVWLPAPKGRLVEMRAHGLAARACLGALALE